MHQEFKHPLSETLKLKMRLPKFKFMAFSKSVKESNNSKSDAFRKLTKKEKRALVHIIKNKKVDISKLELSNVTPPTPPSIVAVPPNPQIIVPNSVNKIEINSNIQQNSAEEQNKMETKQEEKQDNKEVKHYPIIETSISVSKDKKFVIHRTIITDIKPVNYYKAVLKEE